MDETFMAEALNEAKAAERCGEVPVGAVVVKDGVIIGRGRNATEAHKDPTAHAEIIAIREAAATLGGWRLPGAQLYVTLEPCAMCAGAIVLARIEKVWIGTPDPKSGACGSVFNIIQEQKLNHRAQIETGLLEQECAQLMKAFFKERRKKTEEIHP